MSSGTGFAALVSQTLLEMGGRATAEDVASHAASRLTADEYQAHTWAGFVAQVRSALRASDTDGLVRAANIAGEYVTRTLWDASEYRYVARRLMKSARRDRDLASKYAQECQARYAVVIDLDSLLDDEGDEAAS